MNPPGKDRHDIIRLARHDPTVNAAVQAWHLGMVRWEDAMNALVLDLQRGLENTQARLLKCLQEGPPCPLPHVFTPAAPNEQEAE